MIFPKALKESDTVAILSPASKIEHRLVDLACATLERWGFRPQVSGNCKNACGSYSGTADQRLSDMICAYSNPEVRAVVCSRGGYGAVHLLERLPADFWTADPKWLIGFSDISALHAASFRAGVASVHASMCKHLAERPDDDCSRALRDILTGSLPDYTVAPDSRNRTGKADGTIVGGNLAVLSGLVSTPYDLLRPDHILFIEDIGEAIYRIERMLYTLRLNGTLARTRGLIVGQFTDYQPSADYHEMYEMIERMVADYDFPVAYNFPVGHVDHNLPIVEGAHVELTVDNDAVRLTFNQKQHR